MLFSTVAIGLLTKILLEHIQTVRKYVAPRANKLQWMSTMQTNVKGTT